MSASGSQSSSESSSGVWGKQKPFLLDLYRQASGIGLGASNEAQELNSGLLDQFLPQLQQGMTALGGFADPSAQIQAQSDSLQAGLGNLFRNEINPAIEGNALLGGSYGGGRQGVAQGVAAGEMANAYTQGYGDIVANANRQAIGALGMMPQFAMGGMDMVSQGTSGGLDVLSQLAQILGRPTVLQDSSSKSAGFGFGL